MTNARTWSSAFFVVCALGLAACGSSSNSSHGSRGSPTTAAPALQVMSSAFTNNARIPVDFTCTGAGKIPPLSWQGGPAANSMALVVDDPDAPGGDFVHWIVVGMPAGSHAVPETRTELKNSARTEGWTPPCPPGTSPHHYRFTVYAMGNSPSFPSESPQDDVARIKQAALASGTLVGTFSG